MGNVKVKTETLDSNMGKKIRRRDSNSFPCISSVKKKAKHIFCYKKRKRQRYSRCEHNISMKTI